MCIRDSNATAATVAAALKALSNIGDADVTVTGPAGGPWVCLLYTSDAADERSSVDLGGRRIIKKKQIISTTVCAKQRCRNTYECHSL